MLFHWLKQRRRRRILAQPFPPAWLDHLDHDVAHYRLLSEPEQSKLRDDLRIFIAEKEWEGCGGLPLTEAMKVTIAAHACLLVLELDVDLYRRVQTILVYPSGYRGEQEHAIAQNAVLVTETPTLGTAHYRGPVILSWDQVIAEGRHPGAGHNLVFHEFAHQLDMLNGAPDGTPPLRNRQQARRWHRVMSAEFTRLCEAAAARRRTLLDPYGATNEAEFFAVVTECFFDSPGPLRAHHAELYDVLREFYRQDPVKRQH